MRLNGKFLQNYGILISFSVVFWSFYFGALIQGWNAFSLLTLPFFQYLLFVWMQVFHILKNSSVVDLNEIQFHSFGNEKKIARYFFFCSMIEISLVIIMGIEAKYHPQLVNSHFVLYVIPIVLVFIISPFFVLNNLISDTKIVISIENQEPVTIGHKQPKKKSLFLISVVGIGILSLLWIGFSIMGYFDIFAFTISVPATSEKLYMSYFLIPIAILAIIHPIALLYFNHVSILNQTLFYIQSNKSPVKVDILKKIESYRVFPRFFRA